MLLPLALLGCSIPNDAHCGNREGDATCQARGGSTPYCSLCVGDNDGCVAAPVTEAMCRRESDSGAQSSGADTTEGTATGVTTSAAPSSTSSASSTEPGSSSSSGGSPTCGDGKAEGPEECDGGDLASKTCSDFQGYSGGTLACVADACTFDFSGCCKSLGESCLNMNECCSEKCILTCQ